MLVFWLTACFIVKDRDDGAHSGESAPPQQVWPDQERVGFYYGSGGRPGGSTGEGGTDDAAQYIEATYGWHTNSRDDLGEPENFRALFMMDPGWNGGSFSEDDAAKVLFAMERGTRVIVMTSQETCDSGLANTIMEALGAPQRLSGASADNVRAAPPAVDHQITAELTQVYLSDPCVMQTSGATALFSEGRDVYGAVYRPGYGGDVVLLGDYNFMDDTGLSSSGDNLALLGNLAEVVPAGS